MKPVFALIFPLSGMPDNSLPSFPGFGIDPGYGQGHPMPPHPGNALPPGGVATPPIVIPPGAIGPGAPSHPIYLPGSPDNTLPGSPNYPSQGLPGGSGGRPSQGLPGMPDNTLPGGQPGYPSQGLPGSGGRPSNPIVYPPGLPEQGLPPTPGLPPLVPTNPIAGLPSAGQLPVLPPNYVSGQPIPPGGGAPGAPGRDGLPAGSVLLVPVSVDPNRPVAVPPGAPPGSVPVIAWGGRGTLPVVVWMAPQAAPKG